ncbi:MAG: signal peptidase I [Clostridiales bacterium]|nr:MAG: signal peptidase I [Clostridiales bacterium]
MTLTKRQSVIALIILLIYHSTSLHIGALIGHSNYMLFFRSALSAVLIALLYRGGFKRAEVRRNNRIEIIFFSALTLFIYIAITLGSGMIDGFGQNPYDVSLRGIIYNVISFVIYFIMLEMLRDQVVKSLVGRRHRYLYLTLVVLAFSYVFIAPNYYAELSNGDLKEIVEFLGGVVLPTIMLNALLTRLALAEGWKSAAILHVGFEFIYFTLPVLPDQKWITKALIGILLPLVALTALANKIDQLERRVAKRQIREAESPLGMAVVYTFSILIIWFAVGVFPVFPTVIMTGSMEPLIEPGDVVIVQRVNPKTIETGDIIQFQATGYSVVHRVVAKRDQAFTTKGDNNNAIDGKPVAFADVKGKYMFHIPKLGAIPLFLKTQFNQHTLHDVERNYGTGE